ncbi:hypothetical protein RF11_08839 [Thelohanellus kitauei]|uniref:Uncharacterized protein n=1 Tax=Thelohanellus kitauei TaxID=669202 RepID=A0A0C2MBL8_THEKT|nr:hypothetical protein RF11_08839 [Thelohanellus kitauei]
MIADNSGAESHTVAKIISLGLAAVERASVLILSLILSTKFSLGLVGCLNSVGGYTIFFSYASPINYVITQIFPINPVKRTVQYAIRLPFVSSYDLKILNLYRL